MIPLSYFDSPFLKYFKESGGDIKKVRHRIEAADREDISEAALVFAEKAKEHNPDKYYSQAVGVYHQLMEQCEMISQAAHILSKHIKPLFSNNKGEVLSRRDLTGMLGEEEFSKLSGEMPYEYDHLLLKGVAESDIEIISSELKRMDKNRNDPHKELLEYAEKHFKKDYLDVFVDIMGEGKVEGSYMHLSAPENKRGYLVLDTGYVSVPSDSIIEFSRQYGVEPESQSHKKIIEEAHESLRKAREDKPFRARIEYKSKISFDRTEDEDDAFLEEMRERFESYVSFTGEHLIKNMHGRYVFNKILEIDLNKIREKEEDPQLRIEEIKTYAESLLPQEELI
ncbi:MAG: hypothetical protein R6U32_06675 [Candidatus Woesearchaeota archaeon]